MPEAQIRVKFEPHGRVVSVLPGTKVLEAAGDAGLTIDTPCGGTGGCGKCRVRLMTAPGAPSELERRALNETALNEGDRLACQTRLDHDTVVFVPEASLFGSHHQIQSSSTTDDFREVRPAVRKVFVELSTPSLTEDAPDLLRLETMTGPFSAELPLVREIGGKLRENSFRGTAVFANGSLIDFEPGDTTGASFGAAFDIGTTTVVGVLIDLCTGEERALVSRMNPQVSFGDDVLSRITHASSGPEALAALRDAILGEVDSMIGALCIEAGILRGQIYEITFAGNTTMEHLLSGINPAQLGQVPFVPVFAHGLARPAAEFGVRLHPRGAAYVFPVIGGFVGGDTVAGMLATELAEIEGPAFMVDIGTNGEIVLACNGSLWAASTAAGPAFEGARISCGMRATRGAIEKVVLDGDVRCSVIDGARAAGLCGSGLIDAVAELLRAGIITPAGRMLPPEELPPALPEALRARVRRGADEAVEFVLAEGVALNQRDVRELQLASGAIRAGMSILLKQAGIEVSDLKQVLIAGGFGSFIRRSNAQRIGLIPPEIDHQRIRYVGNTSLSGARWALLSTESRRRAESLARQTRHVELSTDMEFAMEFAMAMRFPEVSGPEGETCTGAEKT